MSIIYLLTKPKVPRLILPSKCIIILSHKHTKHLLLWVNSLLSTGHAGRVHCDPMPGRASLWAKISTKSHVRKNQETYRDLKKGFLEFNSGKPEFLRPGLPTATKTAGSQWWACFVMSHCCTSWRKGRSNYPCQEEKQYVAPRTEPIPDWAIWVLFHV